MTLLVCSIPNLRGKWTSYEIGYLKETSIKLLWPWKLRLFVTQEEKSIL